MSFMGFTACFSASGSSLFSGSGSDWARFLPPNTPRPWMEGRTLVSSPAGSSSPAPGSASVSAFPAVSGSALCSGSCSCPDGASWAFSGSGAAVSGAESGLCPSSGFFTPNISLSLSKLFCIFWSSPK